MSRPPAKTLGEFEQVVLLAVLRLGTEAYGAAVRREIEERTGRHLGISAVYTTLGRLEEQRLVSSHVGEPTAERGGRRKKYFEIEPRGREALAESYHTFRRMVAGLERQLQKS